MYCKNSGTELPDGTKFCTCCGHDQTMESGPVQYASASFGEKPASYLALSIIVTILCCVPLGIVGIVYASKVDASWNARNYDAAKEYSRKARNWSIAGLVISVLWWVVYAVLIFLGVAWAAWWDNGSLFSV